MDLHFEVEDGGGMASWSWSGWAVVIVAGLATVFVFYCAFSESSDHHSRYQRPQPRRKVPPGTRIRPKFHVLIPCHVDSDRRALLFVRCMQSVAMQANCEPFEVFIRLSGSAYYRAMTTENFQKIKQQSNLLNQKITWHLDDPSKMAVPQMEHLRSLVRRSAKRDPNAYLLFLDNDDMFHPLRLCAFEEALDNIPLPKGTPLPLSCKLLLDETMGPNEGKLTDLATPEDFFLWRKNPVLRRKIQWVPTSRSDDMDATEYMDFIVPTKVMQKFFRLTPVAISSHRFCDLRLLAILQRLNPMEIGDLPHYPWLLAHYKTTMHTKQRNFDTHGRGQALGAHSLDQASVGTMEPSAKDVAVSQAFNYRLSPGQVALCRGHLESLVIQCIGWDAGMLSEIKRAKVNELNGLHGPGVGDALWSEAVSSIAALFSSDEMNANRGEWQCKIK